jgi:hypothetical protein
MHNEPWHEGITCLDYEKSLKAAKKAAKKKNVNISTADTLPGKTLAERLRHGAEEAAAAETLKRNTQNCPGVGCGIPIQRNHGCPLMQCRPPETRFLFL